MNSYKVCVQKRYKTLLILTIPKSQYVVRHNAFFVSQIVPVQRWQNPLTNWRILRFRCVREHLWRANCEFRWGRAAKTTTMKLCILGATDQEPKRCFRVVCKCFKNLANFNIVMVSRGPKRYELWVSAGTRDKNDHPELLVFWGYWQGAKTVISSRLKML